MSGPEPYYVIRLDPANNALVIGRGRHVYVTVPYGAGCWGVAWRVDSPFACRVQLRSRHDAVPATVYPDLRGATVAFGPRPP